MSQTASTKEFTVLMALLMSIVAISIDALLPALGFIGQDLRIANSNHQQYLITGLFMGMAAGQLVCGPLSDAFGRKKVLYSGIALYLAGSVLCFFADDFSMLLVGRVVQGLGVAAPYVSAVSIVRDKYSGRDMARVMSLVMMIFIMVPAVAPALGQGILFLGGWRDIFLLYIAYSILVGAWIHFRLEETLPPERRIPFSFASIRHGFWEVVGHRATLSYTLCMGVCFGAFLGYLNSCRQIFQEQFGVGEMFTVYFGALALVFGASSLLNSKLVQKLGMRYLCLRSFFSVIIVSAAFLIINMTMRVELWMLLVYISIVFFSFGLLFGNLNAMAMEPMGHIAGIASAVIGSISSLISMAIGAAIGQMYDNTLIPMVSGFLLLGIISWKLVFYTPALQPAH